jgi:periplasmic protein TonB
MMEGSMLAYAPRPERRRLQPSALALIVGAHAVAIVAIMSAKMDVIRHRDPPIVVETIPLPPEPKPVETEPKAEQPANQPLFAPKPLIPPLPLPDRPMVEPMPQPPDPGPLIGNGMDPMPVPQPFVRTGPRFVTPDSDIRPPYPEAKRQLEQEATLKLRLAIDERGRVVAVEPVGRADPAFLAAARRHILKAWRYQPAMEGGKAIASSTVITLKFELD